MALEEMFGSKMAAARSLNWSDEYVGLRGGRRREKKLNKREQEHINNSLRVRHAYIAHQIINKYNTPSKLTALPRVGSAGILDARGHKSPLGHLPGVDLIIIRPVRHASPCEPDEDGEFPTACRS